MRTKPSFELKYYWPKDRAAVAEFFQRVRLFDSEGHYEVSDLLRWKYERPSFCVGSRLLVCRHQNQVVATCGYLSRWMYMVGKKTVSGWVVDLARDEKICDGPEGKMLGFRMVQTLPLDAQKTVPSFVACSFPCRDLVETYSLAGWEDAGVLKHYMKVLNLKKVIRQKHFVGRFRNYLLERERRAASEKTDCAVSADIPGLCFKRIRRFDSSADALWSVLRNKFALVAERDAAYLNWRYAECPLRDYLCITAEYRGHTVGYLIVKTEEEDSLRYGYIVDVFTDPSQGGLIRQCFREAERVLQERGADVLVATFSHARFQAALVNQAFIGLDNAALINAFIITPRYLKSKSAYPQTLARKSEWFITMGDTDEEAE